MTRNNELRDGVSDLSVKSFTPSHVCNNPLIHSGHTMREVKDHHTESYEKNPLAIQNVTEHQGEILIRKF